MLSSEAGLAGRDSVVEMALLDESGCGILLDVPGILGARDGLVGRNSVIEMDLLDESG